MLQSWRPGPRRTLSTALLFLAFLASGAASPVRAVTPSFDPGPCPFRPDPSATYAVTCGTVTVPENRTVPDGPRVRLHIAIVRAANANQRPHPDPIVFLDGGPGLRSLDVLPLRMRVNLTVRRLHESHDLIFWDQRGTGYSEPHLCTSLDTAWFQNAELGYSVPEERRRNIAALNSCAAELTRDNARVSNLSTVTSAADLEDIRVALNLTSWNLFGASYGTRLGLVYLRQSPDSVRSALFDGLYPPDIPDTFAQATRMARVVDLLGQRCRSDERCNARFPEIAARMFQVIAAARRAPFTVPVAPAPGMPVDHVVVNDRLLASGLYQAFYETEFLPYLPALVEQIEKHNSATFEAMAQSLVSTLSYVRQSMDVAVECHDATAGLTAENIARDNAQEPRLAEAFASDASWAAYCNTWQPARATDEERAPSRSATPTLLVSGDFDPVTPPSYATHALEGLSNGHHLQLPNAGHGGKSFFPCVIDVEVAFVDHPKAPLDSSCASNLPRVQFVTNILVLPGLTRMLVGVQSGSHLALIAAVMLTVLLQLVCVAVCATSLLRSRLRPQSLTTGKPSPLRWAALVASTAATSVTVVLALQVVDAIDTNPNVLLLGLAGPQYLLTTLTVLAALLALTVIFLALRGLRAVRHGFLGWLALTTAISFLAASVLLTTG